VWFAEISCAGLRRVVVAPCTVMRLDLHILCDLIKSYQQRACLAWADCIGNPVGGLNGGGGGGLGGGGTFPVYLRVAGVHKARLKLKDGELCSHGNLDEPSAHQQLSATRGNEVRRPLVRPSHWLFFF
jgi:hypothetical protein